MPSELHNQLGHKALCWLSNKCTQRGIRGCVELTIDEGYVADAGAICGLQFQWQNKFKSGFVEDISWVFESKVSRSDFNKTFKKGDHLGDRLIPRANFHIIVTAKGICTIDEIPDMWGWLEECGAGLTIKKLPPYHVRSQTELYEFAYKILRYTTTWKQYNVDQFNSKSNYEELEF